MHNRKIGDKVPAPSIQIWLGRDGHLAGPIDVVVDSGCDFGLVISRRLLVQIEKALGAEAEQVPGEVRMRNSEMKPIACRAVLLDLRLPTTAGPVDLGQIAVAVTEEEESEALLGMEALVHLNLRLAGGRLELSGPTQEWQSLCLDHWWRGSEGPALALTSPRRS